MYTPNNKIIVKNDFLLLQSSRAGLLETVKMFIFYIDKIFDFRQNWIE